MNASYGGETSEVTVSVVGNTDITLKVYYHRQDAAYDGWNLYMWDEDGTGSIEGGQYEFTTAEDGSVVEIGRASCRERVCLQV